MKPRSAPEKGAFVPLSSSRIAGTEPAPMKTSSAVPIASANARCATEKDSINTSPSSLWPARPRAVPRFQRASSLENDIRHYRTPFGERTTPHKVLSSVEWISSAASPNVWPETPAAGGRTCGRFAAGAWFSGVSGGVGGSVQERARAGRRLSKGNRHPAAERPVVRRHGTRVPGETLRDAALAAGVRVEPQ